MLLLVEELRFASFEDVLFGELINAGHSINALRSLEISGWTRGLLSLDLSLRLAFLLPSPVDGSLLDRIPMNVNKKIEKENDCL